MKIGRKQPRIQTWRSQCSPTRIKHPSTVSCDASGWVDLSPRKQPWVSRGNMAAISCHFPREPCQKGKKQCASCRLKIPRKPRRREHADENDESNDDSGDEEEPLPRLDDVLQIAVNRHEVLDLDHYYPKCVPNLPRDLVCPLCRVDDHRTLLLTEMTYSTPDETAQGAMRNLLTFTPRLDRVANAFPPLSSCFFVPGLNSGTRLPVTDFKHALAIHCTHCRNFGMLAPAGLCFGPRHVGDGCGGKLPIGDACGSPVGGILCRRTCRLALCLHALACGLCRVETNPAYCPECYNHDQLLLWHA